MAADRSIFLNKCHTIGQIIIGKEQTIRLLMCSFLAGGHVLLEDRPGVGKSTLAKTFANVFGLQLKRIQMTADLLPSDLLGAPVFDKETGHFSFRPGPIFAPVVFLDELNRASARTQSALLEAMEEGQVTCDGQTHTLPPPFFVIATQNPSEHQGTFELPDSQLDRFLMRLSVGLPTRVDEKEILLGNKSSRTKNNFSHSLSNTDHLSHDFAAKTMNDLRSAKHAIEGIHASPPLIDYILDLLDFSREHFRFGLSPRAGIGLMRVAKAYAFMMGRDFVTPDDVKEIFASTAMHRIGSARDHVKDSLRNFSTWDERAQWILGQIKVRT